MWQTCVGNTDQSPTQKAVFASRFYAKVSESVFYTWGVSGFPDAAPVAGKAQRCRSQHWSLEVASLPATAHQRRGGAETFHTTASGSSKSFMHASCTWKVL